MQEYTLQVLCPHCTKVTEISDWPASAREPILFTCVTQHGGCGGHAYVEPPDVSHLPNLEVAMVAAQPVTPQQAAYMTAKFAID